MGELRVDTLDDLKQRRPNEVAFRLAKLTLEKYFRDDAGNDKPWLFPQLLAITRRWVGECLTCKGGTFPQLLLFVRFAHEAADRIYRSIVSSAEGAPTLKPILRPYDTVGTTKYVDFHTIRETYKTRADKCHVSHVAGDSGWEFKLAQELEDMPEVFSYVKNQSLGFTIPYTVNGVERQYYADFLIRLDDGHGKDDLLNLIVEVTGERDKDKEAKTATARTLWVPAVNNHGGFGRWAFVEVSDPYDDVVKLFRALTVQPASGLEQGSRSMSSATTVSRHGIALPMDQIADFCRRWKIRELALSRSYVRDDFRPDSDLDFLYTFADHARWTLFDLDRMDEELAAIVGHKVDLVCRSAVERSKNYVRRRDILTSAEAIYVEG